jgi:hypothetical protein
MTCESMKNRRWLETTGISGTLLESARAFHVRDPPSAPLSILILLFYGYIFRDRYIFPLYDLGANASVFADSPLHFRLLQNHPKSLTAK